MAATAAALLSAGGADSNADDTDSSSDAGAGAGRPYLTLRRLQLWLGEPLRRMRLLSALVDACEGRVGGNLAGTVWAATKGGDPLATADATRLLHQACCGVLLLQAVVVQ
jgi:Gamma tubulin complex component N-terminal